MKVSCAALRQDTTRSWETGLEQALPGRLQGEHGAAHAFISELWPPDCATVNFCLQAVQLWYFGTAALAD